jgi:hypothetical protein
VEALRDNNEEVLVLVAGNETSEAEPSSGIVSPPANLSFFFFLPKMDPTLDLSFDGFFGDSAVVDDAVEDLPNELKRLLFGG